MNNIISTYWKLIDRFRVRASGTEFHHVWPRWLGHECEEIVKVSHREHACLHYLIWLNEQTGESASAFISCASGWKRLPSGISPRLITEVASWNMSRVQKLRSPEQRKEVSTMGGLAAVEKNAGWHGLTPEQRVKNGKKGNQIQLENGTPARAKTWIVTHPNGHEEIVYNLAEFCREKGLSNSHLCHVAKGHRTHHKNYKVREK